MWSRGGARKRAGDLLVLLFGLALGILDFCFVWSG